MMPSQSWRARPALATIARPRALAAVFLTASLALAPAAHALGFQLRYSYEPNITNLNLGCRLVAPGDVNGDGIADIAASAVGGAWVFYGSPTGPFTAPHWAATGYGSMPANVGDVNGDGEIDLATYDNSTVSVAGHVELFAGGPGGLGSSPMSTLVGPVDDSNWGTVAGVGDVNADGYDDVLVVSDHYGGNAAFGRLQLYPGSPSGIPGTPSWTYTGSGIQHMPFSGVFSAGDVNGDGYADIVALYKLRAVNGNDSLTTVLYFAGSSTGPPSAPTWIFQGSFNHLAGPVDLNGDGYSDLLADAGGSFGSQTTTLAGSSSGPTSGGTFPGGGTYLLGDVNNDGAVDYWNHTDGFTCLCANPACQPLCGVFPDVHRLVISGEGTFDQPGGWIAVGDVNGDGLNEALGGQCPYSNGQTNEGKVDVYVWESAIVDTLPFVANGVQGSEALGTSVAGIGDLNGDGYGDFAVGAPGHTGGINGEGRVSVWLGSAFGAVIGVPAFGVNGPSPFASLGASVAGRGDVNGDGYSDLIMGAPTYTGGETEEGAVRILHGGAVPDSTPDWGVESNVAYGHLGATVACAGDVNGDGFADVLVAAPGYVPFAAEGATQALRERLAQSGDAHAYVYLGSSTGAGVSPAWTADGDLFDGFASAVAGIGDVNRDGYSDVAVGVPGLNLVLIHFGSSIGVATSPSVTLTGPDGFGAAIAAAGDVNGDGFADVAVGAPNPFGKFGSSQAFVFLGSNSGPVSPAAWSASGTLSTQLGAALAGADFDDDGYDDLAVAAPGKFSSVGSVAVYRGSAAGLSSTATVEVRGSEAGAREGASLGAVDRNGNAFADLLIGVPAHDGGGGGEGQFLLADGVSFASRGLAARQLRADGAAPVDLLGASEGNQFQIRARGKSRLGRVQQRLEWQVHALGGAWGPIQRGTWLDSGTPIAQVGSVANLTAQVKNLATSTPYAWRARIVNRSPIPYWNSPWFSPQGNGKHEADLRTGASVLAVVGSPRDPRVRLIADVHPNPTTHVLSVRLTRAPGESVTLGVFDVSGRRIRRLPVAGEQVTWDGRDDVGRWVPAGLYFLRASTESRADARRVVLVP